MTILTNIYSSEWRLFLIGLSEPSHLLGDARWMTKSHSPASYICRNSQGKGVMGVRNASICILASRASPMCGQWQANQKIEQKCVQNASSLLVLIKYLLTETLRIERFVDSLNSLNFFQPHVISLNEYLWERLKDVTFFSKMIYQEHASMAGVVFEKIYFT